MSKTEHCLCPPKANDTPIIGRPVLAIETSCDETAVAVLAPDGRVLGETLLSQDDHVPYGGVVPEIAARAHLAHLPRLAHQALSRARIAETELGAVAASTGPGLIGGLIVGSGFGKGLALALGVPFIGINHIEAHALSPRIPGVAMDDKPGGASDGASDGAPFPYLLMLVSGGHCQCVSVEGVGRYRQLGGTIDDAAGEAFDKTAKLLGLGWPGGPALERLARDGDPRAVPLPRPLLGRAGCDFSFSGLKTAVAQIVARGGYESRDIAASFQYAVEDILADRAEHALAMMRAQGNAPNLLVVAGGVAANGTVRAALQEVARRQGIRFSAPPLALCTDNAVMVGWAALERLRLGEGDAIDNAPRPRWPLDEMSPPVALARRDMEPGG